MFIIDKISFTSLPPHTKLNELLMCGYWLSWIIPIMDSFQTKTKDQFYFWICASLARLLKSSLESFKLTHLKN